MKDREYSLLLCGDIKTYDPVSKLGSGSPSQANNLGNTHESLRSCLHW
ncbi:MAG: hypothetical protein F6K26_50560 [Moorea sp. SIO2I5]|nr:hypothetical protein [Moorena sp. SIO2I5]